jgi:pre-mRNA-splicing factor ISY1
MAMSMRWMPNWWKRNRRWRKQVSVSQCLSDNSCLLTRKSFPKDWNAACEKLAEKLDMPEDAPMPPFPKSSAVQPTAPETSADTSTKRKAPGADEGDIDMADGDAGKRAKVDDADIPALQQDPQTAARISSFFGVLDQASIQAPKQPTKQEMEQILLEVRKKALLEEYGV